MRHLVDKNKDGENKKGKMDEIKENFDYIIPYDKPAGLTSFQSLGAIKKSLGTRKVGHTGTLDKFASGLLIVCTGRLTRLVPHITGLTKTYEAEITFGLETETLDPEGAIIKRAPLPTIERVRDALEHFRGEIVQEPPAFSAIHINGARASDLARRGEAVSIPKRLVTVFSSEIIESIMDEENGRVKVLRANFCVSKGTYIRALARDIASYCDSAAFLTALRRTQVGKFSIDMCETSDTSDTRDIDKSYPIKKLKKLTLSEALPFIDIGLDEAKKICRIKD